MLIGSYQTLHNSKCMACQSCLSSEAKWVVCLALEVGNHNEVPIVYNYIVGLKLVPKEITYDKQRLHCKCRKHVF